jgi:hypothetical protein
MNFEIYTTLENCNMDKSRIGELGMYQEVKYYYQKFDKLKINVF